MSHAAESASIESMMTAMGAAAREAASQLARVDAEKRNQALLESAAAIRYDSEKIIAANGIDMADAAERGRSDAILDRLSLDENRVEAMAKGLETIAELPDPLGKVLAEWQRPNGLFIQRVSVPLGVIGISTRVGPMLRRTRQACASSPVTP